MFNELEKSMQFLLRAKNEISFKYSNKSKTKSNKFIAWAKNTIQT